MPGFLCVMKTGNIHKAYPKEITMKKYTLLIAVVVLPLLSACNTMEGFGQDVQKGGEKIENAADKNK
jgi:entericidin B